MISTAEFGLAHVQKSSSELADPEESSDDEITSPEPSTSAEIVRQVSESGAPPVDPALWPAVSTVSELKWCEEDPSRLGKIMYAFHNSLMHRTTLNRKK